jgi:two-component system cell cycle response regulator DivK
MLCQRRGARSDPTSILLAVAPKKAVLVVEDDPASQLLTQTILEEAGYEVLTARSADDALAQLDRKLPALILMDVDLPGRDGLSLTRLLKTMSPTTSIPVVALTAHSSLQRRQDAVAAGCIGFIAKPIDIHSFPERVAEFIGAPEA